MGVAVQVDVSTAVGKSKFELINQNFSELPDFWHFPSDDIPCSVDVVEQKWDDQVQSRFIVTRQHRRGFSDCFEHWTNFCHQLKRQRCW